MKHWKIGLWTTGLSFVALGIILLFSINGSVQWTVIKYLWPLILIGFGLEIILTRMFQPDARIRFSGFSMFFLIVVCLASLASFSLPKFAFSPTYLVGVNGIVRAGDGIKRVEVQIYDGDVTVDGVDAKNVDYTGELHIFGSSQEDANKNLSSQWKVERNGDSIRFIQQKPDDGIGFSLFNFVGTHAHLDLKVPTELLSNVHTNNGGVHVSHMNADSIADTSNGSVEFDTVEGNVNGTTSNGKCTAIGVKGTAELHTSNGGIIAQDIGSRLTADTSNGGVDVTSPVNGDWDLSTSNGHVNVQLPQNANCNLQGDTSNGNIQGNVDWHFSGDDKNHATGTLGNGTYAVDLKTSNGSIDVSASNQ